jgi:hypothetical protein
MEQDHPTANNIKTLTMKFSIVTFFLLSTLVIHAQNLQKVLKIKNTTSLDVYLSENLKSKIIGDSCYYGIYFIKFKLAKTGNLLFFDCSKEMPLAYKNEIERLLKGLEDKWDDDFLKMVLKKKLTIQQPIFLSIDNHCKSKSYFPKNFDYEKASDSIVESIIARALPSSLAERITNLESSFITSLDYQEPSNSNFSSSIILNPCVVKRIIFFQGSKKEL